VARGERRNPQESKNLFSLLIKGNFLKKALVPERKRDLRERERSGIIKFCFVLCCELGFCGALKYHQHHWELDPLVCVFVVVVVRKHQA
jgi:hypothetical protein